MAPALTEPISPKEKLTSSGTATATPATAARASRKIDTENYITNNNNNNNNNTTITSLKQSPTLREKRNCNNNNSNSIPVVQVPTTSTIRLTRSRDLQQRLLSSSPKCKDKQQHQQQQPIITQSKTPILTTSGDTVNNEQMGLSTAVLETKNQIINQNTNTATTELIAAAEEEHQNPDAVQKAAAVAATKETDTTSTAQLLADLTNEAITADICLRKQLKDVNLVKAVAEGSSSPLQRDRDIVVIKSISTSSPPSNSLDTAHMDTQCSGEEDASTTTKTNDEEGNKYQTLQQGNQEEEEEGSQIKETNHVTPEDVKNSNDVVVTEETNKNTNECHLSSDVVDSYPPDSPLESDEECKKDGNSKAEIISVQELPPVNTDSTMTASEVEDNLEERLSQLDGTAIDSPPPNNDDVEDDKDDVFKSAQLVMESTHTAAATTTPPRTPTHQQTLAKDMQDIQQQLQHTPPTPVAQQVQAHHHHHMQQQQQLQQVPPQQNCLTPQSTASSINTVGSGNIPQSFIKEAEAGTELEDQDIEEVFKVLKGFEGGGSSDLNVCDLNVLFNEAYMKMNESDIGGTTGGNSQVAVAGVSSSSSSISNSHVSHSHVSVATENPSIQPVKPTELEEAQKDIEERQRQMQRKVDILMRRLRKLQARYMCKHTSEEIAGLFELTARQSSKGVNANHVVENPIGSDPNSQDITKYFQKVIASRPPASDWKSEQEELVPAKQISTLLRKIETVANAQQHCLTPVNASNNNNNNNINPNNFHIAPTKKSKKALLEAQQNAAAAAAGTTGNSLKNDTTTLDSSAEGRNAEDIIVATLEENVTTELTQVTGLLQTEMYEVQRAIDSDATESSSGGESADEMVVFNNQQQQTLPITKRAAWRYSRDRAAIASRWSWLLSQIADLEIKIRQHSELYQEILKAKGPVISCPRDNGLKIDRNDKDVDDDALEGSSCRTRGFNPAQFRKRKLIQTTNMHTISKKAARPSTIKCGCQWPIHPCALCTGRADPTAPRDLPDTMMMSERIALLDAGYHPVLSFRENVNNALHFEAIAKQPEWQQRVMRCQAKHIAKSVWKAEREAVAGKKFNDGGAPPIKRRYVKKKDRDDKGTQQQQQQQARGTMPTSTDGAAAGATQMASASSCSVNNDQPTTLATTSTTPLVANKSVTKSGKKQTCQILSDVILKNPSNQQPSPLRLSTTSSAAATVTTATAMNSIHQTSDCHHPTSYDPYNLNPTHSSSISNTSSSKSNKHRKLSSASTAATSHHYNQHNNHLYNGESGFTHHNYDWSGAAGGVDAITARSRTSSPTHGGGTSSNYHSKNERSFDRKNRVSYDIDNIVIPYSVAAATRVEILPYKEIPTPKWRIVNTTTTTATTTTSDETANVETSDNNGNRNITTNGDVLSDDGDNRNSNNNNNNNTTLNTFTKNEIKPTHVDEIKMLAPSSSSLCDSSRSDHKISDKATSHRQTSMCPTTSKDVVVVGVDKGSKCLENGEIILNNGSCEPAMVEEPVEKKPKMEPNVIKNENIQPPSTSSCTSSSASLVHNVDTNDRRIVDDAIGPDDEYCEDISDEAMILRHERALTEERRKFQTFLKFPWSTRSRANRRIDSRAESSGANTPDPSSPAPHTPSVGGGDQDSIPSPSTPSTPLNILDTISEAGDNSTSFLGVGFMSSHSSKRQERRRTTSAKRDFERRSSTPDSKELIPPYEPMRFPLTDEQFEELQSAMPSEHNEDSKRFDDCYFPGGGGGGGLGVGMRTRYCSGPTTAAGNSSSKRSSRSSTMCGGERRPKGSLKNTSSIEDVNAMMTLENNCTDNNNMDDEDYDDYPKHHLATNDDHLTADDCDDPGGIHNDDMMMYGDGEDGDYVFANSRRKHGGDSDGDSTETEPFQDDDPNDPEWRGETEDRSRKKAV